MTVAPSLPSVSFVVIGKNEEGNLPTCLESIVGQSYAGAMDVHYVDSRSTDRSVELAAAIDGVRVHVLDDPRPNAAKGRNRGWQEAHGDLVQFVDGDAVLTPEWTAKAVQAFEDQQVAAVYGWYRELHPEESVYNLFADLDWPRNDGEVTTIGGIVMVRRSCLTEVGGFPEQAPSGEEPLMAIELRGRGYKLLQLPQLMAYHDIAIQSFGEYWRRSVTTGISEAEQAAARRARGESGIDSRLAKNSLLVLGVLALVAAGIFWSSWILAALGGLIALDLLRLTVKLRTHAGSTWHAFLYALHLRFLVLPQTIGFLRWRNLRRPSCTTTSSSTA